MTNETGENALQLYYTSCRRGLSGHAGFQTRAASSGLSSEERREIEGKALYYPPRDLPREPDAGELDQFPVAFRTVALSAGRDAVVRSVYNGKDYSGRWGNYFAHVLVLDREVVRQIDLVDLYTWGDWVGRLPEGQDDREPEPLPALPLETLTLDSKPDLSLHGIGRFLREAEREKTLTAMLGAVFQGVLDSRRVVIRERSAGDGVPWIAAIRKAFPAACRGQLGFSTFQFDPRTASALNATFGKTDFLFTEAERDYEFYVFDFVNGRHSDVPEQSAGEYARTISAWLASDDPERVEGLHEFAALFGCSAIGPELAHILRLHRLDRGEGGDLAIADIREALEFADGYAPPAALSRVIEAAGRDGGAGYLAASTPVQDWALVIRLLARRTDNPEHRAHAWRTWVRAFDVFVLQRRGGVDAWNVLREVRRNELMNPMDGVKELLNHEGQFLSDGNLESARRAAPELEADALHFLVREMCDVCRLVYGGTVCGRIEVRNLVESVLDGQWLGDGQKPDLAWALKAFQSEDGALVVHELREILHHVTDHVLREAASGRPRASAHLTPSDVCRAIGRSVFAVARGSRDRFGLLRALCGDDRFSGEKQDLLVEILLGEWRASLDGSDDIGSYGEYQQKVLPSCGSAVQGRLRNRMAESLFGGLSDGERERQARAWVASREVLEFREDLAARILVWASRSVKLSPGDRRSGELAQQITQIAQQITQIAKSGTREASLPRIELRSAAEALDRGTEATIRWEGVTEAAYREFVVEALRAVGSVKATPEQYGKMLLSAVHAEYVEAFMAVYLDRLQRDLRADAVDVAFWLWPPKDAMKAFPQKRREAVLDALAHRIASQRKKRRQRTLALLERRGKSLDGKELEAFRDRCDRASSGPNWLYRLLRLKG